MTIREVYDYILIELAQTNTSTLLLEDFNYFFNKSINNNVAKKYNTYDSSQQSADDLKMLKTSKLIRVTDNNKSNINSLKPIYIIDVDAEYLHLLNCIVEYEVINSIGCKKSGQKLSYNARRMTSDIYSQTFNDVFLKPSYRRPYYSTINGNVIDSNTGEVISEGHKIQINYGDDVDKFKLSSIYIEYLKKPKTLTLLQSEIDNVVDTTEKLEFPEYVCFEIIKEMTALLLENNMDQRLQTNIPVNIVTPQQQRES